MEIRFKSWLEKDGEVVVGDGKIRLLTLIDELGSIQKAADRMGMSYRHAWGFLRKVEKRAAAKFITTRVGGRAGGGAELTPEGKLFLKRYLRFRDGLDEHVERKFKKIFQR